MSDTVVLLENILDIALWVKKSKMAPFVQGQAVNAYHFQNNRGKFVFLASIMRFFRYAVHSGVVRRYFRHCIVGKKSKMAAIC